MPAPSGSLTSLRPDLASIVEFDLESDRAGFIGHQVLRPIEANHASGTFGRIPLEQLLQSRETKRAPRSGYARGDWTFTEDSFSTREHGAEEPIDDNEEIMFGNYFDAEMIATQRARDVVLRNAEVRIAGKVFDPATWTGEALTTEVSIPWDGPTEATEETDATPVDDVLAARLNVYESCGLWPNAIVMSYVTFLRLRTTEQVKELVTSMGAGSSILPAKITRQQIAEAFDLKHVLVGGGCFNSADEGQTASLSDLWNRDYAMVCRIAETDDISEPCIGRVIHWADDGSSIGGTVETYREEVKRGSIVRVRHQVAEKLLYAECGHLLTGLEPSAG